MTFVYTYRVTDGSLVTATIDADSRTEAVMQLRHQGISTISINVSPAASTNVNGGVIKHKRLLLILIVILLGVILSGLFTLSLRKEKNTVSPTVENRKTEKKPRTTRPVSTNVHQSASTLDIVKTNDVVPVVEEKKDKNKNRDHQTVAIHTNNLGQVVEKYRTADGKLHMKISYSKPPVFDNASDDQLAMAIAGNGVNSIAPIPVTATSEKEFLESLKTPIVINPDDSESVKQLKAAVQPAREDMKALIGQGMSYKEALAEHQKLQNENADIRASAMRELRDIINSGDKDGAEKYLRQINTALGQMGIQELTLPRSREELNALRQQKREEALRRRAEKAGNAAQAN